ncbi:MAG TPA: NINE protein [Brachybacterium sp.]|nr:NINE protein [Brachybacterium sp.]
MSTTGDHGSWNPYGNDGGDHGTSGQAPQDPWAQQPAPHDPYAQPSAGSASDPYGQPGAAAPQYGQQDPYGQPPSAGSASDPYAQGQQSWSPAAGSGAPASDPYGAPAGGPSPYGQSAYAQPAGGPAPQGQAQSRLVVGLLGIFLGGFGVHRFLLGYTKIGLIQVLVSVLSCFILYPLIQIWGLIEGIMVLAKSPTFERDAHGRPLTD